MKKSSMYLPNMEALMQSFSSCSVGITISDVRQENQPIVYVNQAFEQMSGYLAAEIVGQNCRFLQGKDRDQPAVAEIRQALARGLSAAVTLRNYRRDGTLFYNELTLNPIRDGFWPTHALCRLSERCHEA